MNKILSLRILINIVLVGLIVITTIQCNQPQAPNEGPYFGNGFRNGWADQNSVSIWTRLTSIPDLNQSGIFF